jgi:predicted Zn-dependent protease
MEIPTLGDEDEIGQWLHDQLLDRFGLETEDWAAGRVARCAERLNRVRAACPADGACPHPLTAEVLWMQEMNAFAAPGRYVYVTRELLQWGTGDEPVALVLAHEMAHHDLGHLRLFGGALEGLRRVRGGIFVAALYRQLERGFISAEREDAADAYALDLCLAAGYDAKRCLTLFDTLEAYALDHRDLDIVYGPASEGVGLKAFRRLRGYSPLRMRREALRRRLRDSAVTG